MTVHSGANAEAKLGNCLPLTEIPTGLQIHTRDGAGRRGETLPLGGSLRHAHGSRGLVAQITSPGRGPARPGRVPSDDRCRRQRRSHEDPPGQGRPQAVAGRRPHVRGTARIRSTTRWAAARADPGPHAPLADRRSGQGWQDAPPAETVQCHDHPPPDECPLWPIESLIGAPNACLKTK